MTLLEEPEPSSSSKRLLLVGILLVVAAAVGVAIWMLSAPSAPASKTAAAPIAERPRAVPAPPVLATAPKAEEAPSPEPRRAKGGKAPARSAAPPAAPTAGTLQFDSDVAGASVFLDREYKGVTPLTIEGVAPGSHKVNVSADGYDGYADTVEVAAGPNAVLVRFKEVKLNESIPVAHKHAIGSCSGRLVADTTGIRYETSKADDAFKSPFAKIETFEVDYLKKNLRIKLRGGRTYNFSNENADTLFVFHKNVQAARAKLAKEGTAPAPVM